jgi:hypothetical protein
VPRPELRPRAVGEIIDAAIKLVVGNARVLFTIAAVILIPLGVLQLVVYALLGGGDMLTLLDTLAVDPAPTLDQIDEVVGTGIRFVFLALGLAVLAGFGTVLVQGATVKAAADVYQGVEPEWQGSIRHGLRRFLVILVAVIAVGVASGVGLLFCLLPGIWLFTSWSVTVPSVVVEGLGPFSAMRRSFQLVRPRFWPTLGAVVLSYIVYLVVTYMFTLIGSLFTLVGEPTSGVSLVASVISSTVGSVVVLPFIAAVLIVLYFDLRVRAEGYDLEVMAMELGETTRDPRPPIQDPDDPFGLGAPGTE